MASYKLVADVASYQPDSPAFYLDIKAAGVSAVIVKLTEGEGYVNPKAAKQISNAAKAGLLVHAYHYARWQTAEAAQREAAFFVATAKRLELTGSSVLADDIEDAVLPAGNLTQLANVFTNATKAAGYNKTDVYTMASWIWAGRLRPTELVAKNLWIASYGTDRPGVDNVGTWQFTSSWQGYALDMSYDFKGLYTGNSVPSRSQPVSHIGATYTVRPGDSWWAISARVGVSIERLLATNNSSTKTVIRPGQILKLP